MTDRPYDLVLLGATGFTGRLVARHLGERLAGSGLRWAIAGRDATKLAEVAAGVPGDPAEEVVDVSDLVGLLHLAERTRVLGTTVGPYLRHGELVVQACVRAGTHYADITGESAFVRLVSERYGADAQHRGVQLVSCCGFDSVPPDLGAQMVAEALPQDASLAVRAYLQADARFSGGTVTSGLTMLESEEPGLAVVPLAGRRPVHTLGTRPHRVAELDAWALPLPTIDPAIVLRSASALEGYGRAFRYGHYVAVGSLPRAVGSALGAGAALGLARLRSTRALLRRLAPDPGEGPSPERRARSSFTLTLLGQGGGQRVIGRVAGGDPGYDEAATMLGEALLSLALDPRGPRAGHLTPAAALGVPYRERLEEQGLTFAVESA